MVSTTVYVSGDSSVTLYIDNDETGTHFEQRLTFGQATQLRKDLKDALRKQKVAGVV